ncbi:dipeptide ABC transporter ATP-binding protein [uncultured Jannaschia sp.]|uniref:ABC transporter ATP-binding protein n=1 Tax=uncultured Jannaschia sp. TaxID=293347 RepID=UPI00260E7A93|nr:dipeptide ABC transporter ATP-binding protein [uncultured Jannaschia sp.]
MNEVVLEAVGLEKRFTRKRLFAPDTVVRAVNGVDLAVRRGETYAIVGESGCGKSTMARLLLTLMKPSDGTVLYEGRDTAGMSERELRALRRDLQVIFQDPFSSLNPQMSVGALIEEPLRVHGIGTAKERRAKAAEMLARVGLRPEHADRYPHEFSGGQRQRIGIARALVTGPQVVIGDEPVSALDVSIQAQVINILAALKAEMGLTLVLIAHDLAVIRHMADRVAVMYLGEVIEEAPADDLFARPAHPYTAALMAAIPIPEIGARPPAATLEGEPPNPVAPPPGCRFHPRCPHARENCRTDRPALRPLGDRRVACHYAEELTLPGIATETRPRAPGVARRFALLDARTKETDGGERP